jgi:hypothetical protein
MAGQNIYQTSSNLFNAAAQGPNINQFMNPYANSGPNINQFMNPYTRQVVDQSMADLERQRQTQINATGAAASNAGAFGGSRHGVAEAQTNLGFGQQGAQMASNLRQQGFNTALQAAQNQQQTQIGGFNTALQAAQNQQQMQSGLAGQGFGFGQAIGNQQAAQGAQTQAMNQALIDAARGQFGGFTGAPQNSLQAILAALGGMPNQSSTKQTQNPGIAGFLGTFLGM